VKVIPVPAPSLPGGNHAVEQSSDGVSRRGRNSADITKSDFDVNDPRWRFSVIVNGQLKRIDWRDQYSIAAFVDCLLGCESATSRNVSPLDYGNMLSGVTTPPPTVTRWLCAVASSARTRSTICAVENSNLFGKMFNRNV